MMPSDNKPYFKLKSIATVDSLALHLSIPPEELIRLSNSVDKLWKQGAILKKKNGDPRPTLDAKKPLKDIHEKIKTRLLKHVSYPRYLLGGISDKFYTRDYKKHAQVHSGKKYLIEEDVKDFFPSTSVEVIKSTWQHLFNFPPDVADILTKLTTLNGSLPQGWKTSGYLANLVFWDIEYLLVNEFNKRGIAYSRFMDDISVSTQYKLNKSHKTFIVSSIYKMLFSQGFVPKRNKHEILSASNRMTVTGLNVNSDKPSLSKAEKNKIKAAVHECEILSKNDRSSDAYKNNWNSVSGRVGKLKRFHPRRAVKLREQLTAIKPL